TCGHWRVRESGILRQENKRSVCEREREKERGLARASARRGGGEISKSEQLIGPGDWIVDPSVGRSKYRVHKTGSYKSRSSFFARLRRRWRLS
ncbi:unnamed protein product, partial [Pylaiella littoralis]